MKNPYMPPLSDTAGPAPPRWWRRPSIWLACVEVIVGIALGFGGCFASLATDSSLAGPGAAFALFFGVGVIALPGMMLFGRHRLRWLGQLLPAGVALWLLLTWLRK
jgi:hypothetical protein